MNAEMNVSDVSIEQRVANYLKAKYMACLIERNRSALRKEMEEVEMCKQQVQFELETAVAHLHDALENALPEDSDFRAAVYSGIQPVLDKLRLQMGVDLASKQQGKPVGKSIPIMTQEFLQPGSPTENPTSLADAATVLANPRKYKDKEDAISRHEEDDERYPNGERAGTAGYTGRGY
jgi:hypothetical protein